MQIYVQKRAERERNREKVEKREENINPFRFLSCNKNTFFITVKHFERNRKNVLKNTQIKCTRQTVQ